MLTQAEGTFSAGGAINTVLLSGANQVPLKWKLCWWRAIASQKPLLNQDVRALTEHVRAYFLHNVTPEALESPKWHVSAQVSWRPAEE